jgi:hypothetical protein
MAESGFHKSYTFRDEVTVIIDGIPHATEANRMRHK